MKQEQRLQAREKNRRLFEVWTIFSNNELTAIELLDHLMLICKRKTAVAAALEDGLNYDRYLTGM